MRMLTIRRTALLGLLVLGVGLMACTGPANEAKERRDAAQIELAERAGISVESPGAGTGGGGGASTPADPSSPAALGQQVATQYGCTACHTINGQASVGPTWQGLSGHEVELADGSTVTADDAYLEESITDPNAKIVDGFQASIMPQTFGTQLSAEQISQIIEYIKTLE